MSRVAAIQMTSQPDVQENLHVAAGLIARAAEQGAELVLLPECFAALGNSHNTYRESRDYDFGNALVCLDSPVGRLGLSICYDVRFPELYQGLRLAGAELIVVPAAFTAVTGAAHWEVLLRARAIETQCYLLAANQTGTHAGGRQTFGHSCLIDPWGELVAVLPEGPGIAAGELDRGLLSEVRQRMPPFCTACFAAAGCQGVEPE